MKFCLDRKEGGFAVCFSEEENAQGTQLQYDFSLEKNPALCPLADGTLFEATLSDGEVLSDVTPLFEETEARRAQAKARLHALFNRKKKG